jgi:hypothetical protein
MVEAASAASANAAVKDATATVADWRHRAKVGRCRLTLSHPR